MRDRGADLRLDVVAHDRHAGLGELLRPHRVGGDEDRQRVDEGHLRVQRALRVEAVGLLRAHRQVGDEHVDPVVTEHLDHVDGRLVGLVDDLLVELAQAVEGVAPLDGHPRGRHIRDLDRVVLAGDDGLGQVAADLLGVHVEGGDELDVADVVVAELHVHEARHPCVRVRVLVVVNALDQ